MLWLVGGAAFLEKNLTPSILLNLDFVVGTSQKSWNITFLFFFFLNGL